MIFAVTRFSDNTRYSPFARRVFYIDPQNTSQIRILSGTYGEGELYTSTEDIDKAVDVINNYRYIIGIPIIPIETGGYEYYLSVTAASGKTNSYRVSKNYVLVNGFVMLGNTGNIISLFKPIK